MLTSFVAKLKAASERKRPPAGKCEVSRGKAGPGATELEGSLGIKIDANKALMQFGPDALIAVIELCEAHAMYAPQGIDGYEPMLRASSRARQFLDAMAEIETERI